MRHRVVVATFAALAILTTMAAAGAQTTSTTSQAAAAQPATFGVTVDGWGGIHQWSLAENPVTPRPVIDAPYWPGWDIARGVALTCDGSGGYVLDAWGGLHPFRFAGSASPPAVTSPPPYTPGADAWRDITIDCSGHGYTLNRNGTWGRFAVGGAPLPPVPAGPTVGGEYPYAPLHGAMWNHAIGGQQTLVALGGDGYTWVFSVGPGTTWVPARGPLWPDWDIARGLAINILRSTPTAVPGLVVDGWGGLHSFMMWGPGGGGTSGSPGTVVGAPYWPGWDIVRGIDMSTVLVPGP